MLAAFFCTLISYLPPGTAGVEHLCLIYHGKAVRPAWTAQSLRPYVAEIDTQGRALGWLFDSFLFIEFETDQGRQLYYAVKNKPQPDLADWQWLADAWFRPDSGLIGLEQCVEEVGREIKQPDRVVNVVITLPVPLREMGQFGPLPGADRRLDFAVEADRQAAMQWYIDTVRGRFTQAGHRHLKLAGFYWTGESIGRGVDGAPLGAAVPRCRRRA